MNRAEAFKAMELVDLAEFLISINKEKSPCSICAYENECHGDRFLSCHKGVVRWLSQKNN